MEVVKDEARTENAVGSKDMKDRVDEVGKLSEGLEPSSTSDARANAAAALAAANSVLATGSSPFAGQSLAYYAALNTIEFDDHETSESDAVVGITDR